MERVIFHQDFKLSHTGHQSHIVYRFQVPGNTNSLRVEFQYGPLLETNKLSMRRSLDKEGLYQDSEDDHDGFRNLLTLSINDPQVFRGAHHYFNTDQVIELSRDQASLGFVPGEIHTGMWEVVLSSHGIFSDHVEGKIQVTAIGNFAQAQQSCPFATTQALQVSRKDRTRDFTKDWTDQTIELHSHTLHSDASQSTEELLSAAHQQGLDWLAITDHNTISAIYEAQALLNKSGQSFDGLNLIAGIEYTTFYGHFLVHGPLDKVQKNWTGVTLDNVDQYFAALKAQGVNITLAHPYDTGNPYCTGCRFDYPILDYRYVDNIEVWNETNPLDRRKNLEAYRHWNQLLEAGLEINASMGRDWHRPTPGDAIPVTHVLAPSDANQEEMLQSLNLGRTYVTLGGKLSWKVNDQYIIGDRVEAGINQWGMDIQLRDLHPQAHAVVLHFSNRPAERKDIIVGGNDKGADSIWTWQTKVDMTGQSFVRLEVVDNQNQPLLFTNPIYHG